MLRPIDNQHTLRRVERALDGFAAEGISRTHVFGQIDNEAARGFWDHLGWQQRVDLRAYSRVTGESDRAR